MSTVPGVDASDRCRHVSGCDAEGMAFVDIGTPDAPDMAWMCETHIAELNEKLAGLRSVLNALKTPLCENCGKCD